MFNKQYNGKLDRVALYQSMKSYWDRKPYLTNLPLRNFDNENTKDELSLAEKIKIQKLKNIRKPISHYLKKF